MTEKDKHPSGFGISGLPRPWSTVVQLVGTFGLAVFLVLYYVLVIHPQEEKRYEELRQSVEGLIQVVEKGQTLLTTDQAKHLESLYIIAVASELSLEIYEELQQGTSLDNLENLIRTTMLQRTELLEGLVKKGGRSISEPIVHRIADPEGVSQKAAEVALQEWKDDSLQQLSRNLQEFFESGFTIRRMAK